MFYVLTITFFGIPSIERTLTYILKVYFLRGINCMIVAVVVGMTALGDLNSPRCPLPLLQSEITGKAIDINFFFLSSRKFH